jgi:hypothetical protein
MRKILLLLGNRRRPMELKISPESQKGFEGTNGNP